MGGGTSVSCKMEAKKAYEKVTAIILAAGLSRRMGEENKLMLPFGSSTIVRTTIYQVLQSDVEEVIAVIGHDDKIIREHINDLNVRIAVNKEYRTGLVSSIKCGIRAMRGEGSFMIALADMPLIQAEDYNNLIRYYSKVYNQGFRIVRPKSRKGQPGNPVIFDNHLRESMLANTNLESSKPVIMEHQSSLAFYLSERSCYFADIDSPEDYGRLRTSG